MFDRDSAVVTHQDANKEEANETRRPSNGAIVNAEGHTTVSYPATGIDDDLEDHVKATAFAVARNMSRLASELSNTEVHAISERLGGIRESISILQELKGLVVGNNNGKRY